MKNRLLVTITGLFWLLSFSAQAASLYQLISSGSDDAYEVVGTGQINLNNTGIVLGHQSGNEVLAGFRFPNASIPQGSVIESARVIFASDGNFAVADYGFEITLEDSSTSQTFSTTTSNLSTRAQTPSVTWTGNNAWFDSRGYSTIPLRDSVQRVVNRADWTTSSAITVLLKPTVACRSTDCQRQARAFDNNQARSAYLEVQYVTKPVVKSIETYCSRTRTVLVKFTEDMDEATATNVNNYQMDSFNTVQLARLLPDRRTVQLTINNTIADNTVYQFTISNVLSETGVAIDTTAINLQPPLNGLRADYFADINFVTPRFTRIDPQINFDFTDGSPDISLYRDFFSVRWQGFIRVPTTGDYTFKVNHDDAVKLNINNNTLIDQGCCNTNTASAPVNLNRFVTYPVVVELSEFTGNANLILSWIKPDGTEEIIPSSQFFVCDSNMPQLLYVQSSCLDTTQVRLRFNRSLDNASATDISNYQIDQGVTISSAVLEANGEHVVLNTSSLETQRAYNVTATNIRGSNNQLNTSAQTQNFKVVTNGLLAEYFDSNDLTNKKLERLEKNINLNSGATDVDTVVRADNFTARFTGFITVPATGDYTFFADVDDAATVTIDGTTILDNTATPGAQKTTSSVITLNEDQFYPIVVTFRERFNIAKIILSWLPPGGSEVVVPNEHFFLCNSDINAPTITNVTTACGSNSVIVRFNEAVSTSAEQISNYTLDQGVTVSSAILSSNQSSVELTLNNANFGTNYELVVNNVADLSGNIINVNTTLNFDYNPGVLLNGALGEYFDQNGVQGAYLTGNSISRIDANINFGFGNGSPINTIPVDHFSIRWTTTLIPDVSGNHIFQFAVDDGVRVYLDDVLIIDDFVPGGTRPLDSSPINLTAGQEYELRVEYFDETLNATAILRWQRPSNGFFTVIGTQFMNYCYVADAELVTFLPLDETDTNGTFGELKDSSANSRHATTVGNTASVNANVCFGVNVPANNSSQVDAINTSIDPNALLRNNASISFWYRSNVDWGSSGERVLFDATGPDGQLGFKQLSDGRLQWQATDSTNTVSTVTTAAQTFTSNDWVYITVQYAFEANIVLIYLNGTLATRSSISSSNILDDVGTLYFGDNGSGVIQGANSLNAANGIFDEIKIYKGLVDLTQIQADRDTTRPCASTDHFNINHDGSAVTCEAEPVTISARLSDRTIDTTYTGTINLTTSTSHGDWQLVNGNGTLMNGALNDGAASYTFLASDGGSVQFRLKNTTTETLNINVTDGSISEITGSANVTDDPNLVFAETGFVFVANNVSSNIGHQIAGKPSSVQPGLQTIFLRAVRTNDETGACETVLQGNQTIQLAYECINPAVCNGNQLLLENNAVAGNNAGNVMTFTDVPLSFGDEKSSQAVTGIQYNDVGEIRIHARYTLPLGDDAATASTNLITGTSNAFVSRPFAYRLNLTGNPGASSATGNVFTTAATPFSVQVEALQWQQSDDASQDGIADGHNDTDPGNNVDLSDNALAVSFGRESPAPTVQLSSYLVAPASGSDPGLSGTTLVQTFTNGSRSSTVRFDEVGIIELRAQYGSGDYLGIGMTDTAKILGTSGYVGRFYPAYFNITDTTLTNRDALSCSSASAFTYLGESLRINYQLTANNAAANVTQNYTGGFARLNLTDPLAIGIGGRSGSVNLTFRIGAAATGTWLNGVSQNAQMTMSVNRLTSGIPDGPFLTTQLAVAPGDSDGVTIQTLNLDTDNDGTDDRFVIGTTNLFYGRLRLANVFGSERLPLTLPLSAEYFSNNQFITNRQDNCTAYAHTDLTYTDRRGLASDPVSSGISTLSNGQLDALQLLQLDSGNQAGSIVSTLPVNSALQFDWNDDGVYNNNPSSEASFGLFDSDNGQVYLKEIY